MRRRVLALASSLALLAAPAFAAPAVTTALPPASLATAAQLREQALADTTGWQVVESLTTEIGPRIAGSEADARAVPGPRRASRRWALTGSGKSR